MDLFDVALKLEKDSREFYLKQVEANDNQGLKKIFQKLADDEQKHYEYVQNLKKDYKGFEDSDVLKESKNIFTQLLEEGVRFQEDKESVKAYEMAQKLEKESMEYYQKMQEDFEDENAIALLKKLENEEKQHYLVLQDLIHFMRKPDEWVEDAEFNHLEDY